MRRFVSPVCFFVVIIASIASFFADGAERPLWLILAALWLILQQMDDR